jgi:hypothetical protein
MAKAFSTVKLLKGKEPFLRRIVCEVRFRDGQLYLDHTGRLLKRLVRDPTWVVTPEPTSQGATVFHMVEGIRLSFSMHSASLDLDWSNSDEVIYSEEVDQYIARAEETLGFVVDELEVTEYERLGFRQWYYFSFDAKEETEQWLRELRLFSFSPDLAASFNATPESLGVSLILQGQECHYRIALNSIERSAQLPMGGDTNLNVRASGVSQRQKSVLLEALKQKRQRKLNSSYAAVLDIDTYRNEPKELDLSQFLTESSENNLERFRNALPQEEGKKGK